MSRKSEIERKKKLLADLRAGKKAPKKVEKKKEPKKKEKEMDLDVNDDGVVDEKDVEAVKKKIVKKKKG